MQRQAGIPAARPGWTACRTRYLCCRCLPSPSRKLTAISSR
ncbi:MAG: hypothetical protein OJF48_002133 [Afipia sp.]|nr:MAG: hypothetical protein OJF48_002133 [Afipia sp.]